MRVDSLKFTQSEDSALPSEVTVTMSITEAAQIALIFGKMSHADFKKLGWVITDIYSDLTDNVFNRYWDDGVGDNLAR